VPADAKNGEVVLGINEFQGCIQDDVAGKQLGSGPGHVPSIAAPKPLKGRSGALPGG
jgi:hypothetical protein